MEMGSPTEALSRGMERNGAAIALYRAISRRSGERWLAGMSGTWREQREGLAEELSRLATAFPPFLDAGKIAMPPPIIPRQDIALESSRTIVEVMRDIENEDLDLYAALAQAIEGEPNLAQQLSSIAERAKLRIKIAESHLDLLALE
ncbi:MAG TPA: hypothetical protein VMV44_01705 [Rectinemataceae bacterium]|nr:hypothetical protein [Rectinemataceae bacterium]